MLNILIRHGSARGALWEIEMPPPTHPHSDLVVSTSTARTGSAATGRRSPGGKVAETNQRRRYKIIWRNPHFTPTVTTVIIRCLL